MEGEEMEGKIGTMSSDQQGHSFLLLHFPWIGIGLVISLLHDYFI